MKQSVDFKGFWDKMGSPVHAHSTDVWYDRYAQEILGFLSGSKSVVDAGCGSGEILLRIAPLFMKVWALDYSKSMLEKAREKLTAGGIFHVDFFWVNFTNIGKHCDGTVDGI
jgi:ubiquinone/menaquinone biosynthesis C-methylase UbiE